MSEFVVVGSSLLEEKLMEFLAEGVNTRKVNKMNALVMRVQGFKFDLSGRIQERESGRKELVIPKCEISQNIEIPLDEVLLSVDSFRVVSPGRLFGHIFKFLKLNSRVSELKDEYNIILICGSYFSKQLSLLIKYKPCNADTSHELIQPELFRQAYEDTLSLLMRIPNTVVNEAEVSDLRELDFNKIMKAGQLEKEINNRKLLNYSKSYNCESNIHKLARYPCQGRDIIFRMKSLALSSSSYSTISLFMDGQLTCARIVITPKQIDITPVKQKFRDITSIFTFPSLYLLKMQNNHTLLINWSPDQSCSKSNRVIYTSLQTCIIQIIGAIGVQVNSAITLKTKTEINDYFHG